MLLSLLTMTTGAGLPEQLKRRDRPAWDQMVHQQHKRIFNLHLRLTGDTEAAADLTQETFPEAYQNAHTYEGRSKPEVWLYGVALNLNRSWWRERGRNEPPVELCEDIPDPAPTAEQLAQLSQQAHVVYAAVQRLPETYRRVVALRYFAGVPATEIAAVEEVDAGTVRWRLHHALRKLWVMLVHDGAAFADAAGKEERNESEIS